MKNKAFTLIEISLVMMIVSLLVGLIISGVNLVKTSQYRNIISDLNYYFMSVKNFQSRYNALPGDMKGTSSYWGGNTDGNADGKIGSGNGGDPTGEPMRAWQHLALSGIISGTYTGLTAGTPNYKNMINTPITPVNGGYYSLYYFNNSTGIYGKNQNAIAFASQNALSIPWSNSIITPADAYAIDSKADDGSPYTGLMYVTRGDDYNGVSGKCVSNDLSASNTSFIFTDDTVSCKLIYWLK